MHNERLTAVEQGGGILHYEIDYLAILNICTIDNRQCKNMRALDPRWESRGVSEIRGSRHLVVPH